ncbi:MAG: SpoIIE family protein phosphatase [Acidobacteriota bacterium]|nr:SpoIIE family protein phosphatase [Acidobacteriota bacterium]MDH3522061.1 SpoIIE family protein phosphatase [Acidobacteriota bacterium]
MMRLLVNPAQGEPFAVPLHGEELVIGRGTDCDVTIADSFLSRRHARLFKDGDSWRLEDLGSRNGTFLSGVRVEGPMPIAAGDEIALSSSVVRIEDPAAPRAPARPRRETSAGDHTVFRSASELLASQATISPQSEESVEILQSHAQRLQILNDVHQVLARSLSVEELLETLLGRTFDLLRPEEAVIVLREPDGSFRQAARKTAKGYEEHHLLSQTLIREVADNGQAALVLDVARDDRFAQAESILDAGVRSLIAAPLADAEGSLGMIALNSRLHRHRFNEADMELLTSLGSVAALRLRNLELAEEAAERRRLEDEVRLARTIQLALLPSELPTLEGYELHGATEPSQGVSGDFFEVVEGADGATCFFVVTDVSGKGISASLLTASIEALLAGPLEAGLEPDRICAEVSKRLWDRTSAAKYATALLVRLEPASGALTYANAGHNPALVVRAAGESEALAASGPPIGLLPTPEFASRRADLGAGDLLVLYTDGITEAANPAGEEFGLERLREICLALRAAPLEDLDAAVNRALLDFAAGEPFADDRTLVLLRRRPGR